MCSKTADASKDPGLFGMTPREVEVLKEVAKGDPDKWGCDNLGMCYQTYRNHIKSIFAKLGLHSKTALTRFAYEHQLL